eukprot:TRINITY_DN571_c1_g1_i6.p1 TRINITY_DN571_c1_g1~~TRINITY_DN571_c1_g1_i6.p1  ORF type:complete len:456 (+),score=133.41 TRINITY_DN571_c1_g1_i6:154-1521(+)
MSAVVSPVVEAPHVPAPSAPSPLLSSEKFASINSKVRELAQFIASSIRRNKDIMSVPRAPGLVSAASILLAAKLEDIPLKSIDDICVSTGLVEADLQAFYKQLVAFVPTLTPPNYVPASKVRLYRKMSVDVGSFPPPSPSMGSTSSSPPSSGSPPSNGSPPSSSVASTPSPSTISPNLAAFSLSQSALPDMCAVKAESIVSSPSPTLPSAALLSATPSMTPTMMARTPSSSLPLSSAASVVIPLSLSRRGSLSSASIPSSPSLAARRGSICTDETVALFLQSEALHASPRMQPDSNLRRPSLSGPPSGLGQPVPKPHMTPTMKNSARQAAAVMASLANMDAADIMVSRQQFIEQARTPPTHALPMPVPPAPTPRTPSMTQLGRRGSSSFIADGADEATMKRSRIGINDLCASSAANQHPLSTLKTLQLSPGSLSDSESASEDDDVDLTSSPPSAL